MARSPDAFIVDFSRQLLTVVDLCGHDSPQYRRLVADYRAMADSLGCRSDLEEALLQVVLRARGHAGGDSPATSDTAPAAVAGDFGD